MSLINKMVLGGLFLLFSCTPENSNNLCDKGQSTPDAVCVEIYQPVLAPDGTVYPNSCYAERDGWDNICLTLLTY